MKIIFFCGCLEGGRDGVGDYTKRLAGELVRQGHQIGLAALNDPYIQEKTTGIQYAEGAGLPVLRLPSVLSANKRLCYTTEFINNFNPEWLSLQFVPFAFHPKGLPFFLKNFLTKVSKGRRWHIMFHELWVGKNGSNKMAVYAALQKMIIRNIKKELNPQVIHTHLPYYYTELKEIMFDVKPLPLFANIPVSKKYQERSKDEVFRIGVFSQIQVNKLIIDFLVDLKKTIWKKEMPLEVLLIGENDQLKNFGLFLEKSEDFKNAVKCTGFIDDAAVSYAIQTCNIGLTSVPTHALGKSGSVAAFLSHQVPVAAPCIDMNNTEIGFFSQNLCQSIIINPDFSGFNCAVTAVQASKNEIEVSKISEIFLKDLRNFSVCSK